MNNVTGVVELLLEPDLRSTLRPHDLGRNFRPVVRGVTRLERGGDFDLHALELPRDSVYGSSRQLRVRRRYDVPTVT
jgi:hypothetical protein